MSIPKIKYRYLPYYTIARTKDFSLRSWPVSGFFVGNLALVHQSCWGYIRIDKWWVIKSVS